MGTRAATARRRITCQDTPEARAFERIVQRAWAKTGENPATEEEVDQMIAEARREAREERHARGR